MSADGTPEPNRSGSLRSLILPAYLPAVLYGVGQGAVQPIIAHSAIDLGASVAFAGFVVALVGIGQICADLPVGALVTRIGEKRSMLLAVGLDVVALLVCIYATSLWMLCLAIACTGASGAVWMLARQVYVAEVVPFGLRARALSTLGGTHRIGMFIGPFVAVVAIGLLGTVGGYWVHLGSSLLAGIALLVAPDLAADRRRTSTTVAPVSVWTMVRRYRKVLGTLGVCVLLVAGIRASRQVALPLWSSHIGLDGQSTSLIFGIAGAVDMLLFYPAGKVMDRFGRVWIAVPSVVVLALALLMMPLTQSFGSLLVVALVLGAGNGIGSGIIMTLGADVSPRTHRASFLGSWRLLSDSGNAVGPLLLSTVAATAGLGAGILAIGGLGLAAAVLLGRWVPKYGVGPEP
ncbi:MFS transporter [Saxibacter everestensis]|uniref:MFS transporter n=1 Tax=Saxibacter everestensis TaxID=2909229 RepID=A0ABY8QPI8_9MICO|nr:MFS transporter [Brevibacteriaceae bacterium ZFBP1038]